MSFKEEILCEDYNGYYLVDEQCVRINRPNSDKHNFVQTIIANNSIWYFKNYNFSILLYVSGKFSFNGTQTIYLIYGSI